MTDTAEHLISLADKYAQAFSKNMQEKGNWYAYGKERQALKDELVRLFTPLTDDEIYEIYTRVMKGFFTESKHYWETGRGAAFARAIEAATRQKAGTK